MGISTSNSKSRSRRMYASALHSGVQFLLLTSNFFPGPTPSLPERGELELRIRIISLRLSNFVGLFRNLDLGNHPVTVYSAHTYVHNIIISMKSSDYLSSFNPFDSSAATKFATLQQHAAA